MLTGVLGDLQRKQPILLRRYGLLIAASTIAILLVGCQIHGLRITSLNGASVYLLVTLLAATSCGYRVGFVVAAISSIMVSFFFLEPIYGFGMSDRQHILALPVFFMVAAIGASLRQNTGAQFAVTDRRPTNVIEVGALRVDPSNHLAFVDGHEVHLTPTEFKLLAFFVSNPGRILRPQAILENVWGAEYAKDVRILRTYVNQLRGKLSDPTANPRFIRTEPGFGYRLLAPDA